MRNLIILISLTLSLQGCFFAGAAAGAAGVAVVYDHRKIANILQDQQITKKISDKLMDDYALSADNHIEVSTFNQVVLLTGQTKTAEQRQAAEAIARSVPDVTTIYNEITVKGATSSLTRTSDAWITTKIKTQMLATQNLQSGTIKVVTENGTVYLMGVVSRDQADMAVDIARKVSGVAADVINTDSSEKLEDLLELNPYGNTPTLVDRELVLYDANIIMEYLDERFPHPPLMPVYPVARAKTRLMIYRIDREWSDLVRKIEGGKTAEVQAAAKELRNYLIKLAPVFNSSTYFLNEEFSLVDCCIAPILWRLPLWGITLPPEAKAVLKYADHMFARDSFQASLTEAEQDLRKASSKTDTETA